MVRFLIGAFLGGWLALAAAVERPPIDVTLPIPFLHPHFAVAGGWRSQRDALQRRVDELSKPPVKREAAAAAITADVGRAITTKQVAARARTKALRREVPTYVPPEADDRCTVPAGFVQLHDAAAAGAPEVPGPAGGSVEADSGVDLSAVADTVVANYGAYWQLRAEVEGWRAWYARQKAEWDRP